MSGIQDFGEKIHGARKDAHQRWTETLNEQAADGVYSMLNAPLSASWPEPNYLRASEPNHIICWVKAAREQLGPKPGSAYVRQWAARGRLLRDICNTLINNPNLQKSMSSFKDIENYALVQMDYDLDARQQANTGYSNNQKLRDANTLSKLIQTTTDRARLYENWGLDKSLKMLHLSRDIESTQSKPLYIAKVQRDARSIRNYYRSYSWDEFVNQLADDEYLKPVLAGEKPSSKSRQQRKVNLQVISYRGKPEHFVATKRGSEWVRIAKFDTYSEAKAAFTNPHNHEVWQKVFADWLEQGKQPIRADSNEAREGINWRDGLDISPQVFNDTFGFRGVQFGNYVEGPRRQADLNNAYDALLDLAYALDIAPNALSLDGTLGLAFGARGRGGVDPANAHYEPGHVVINLTKNNGAGSLAHEWFHAFDNFIGKTAPDCMKSFFTDFIAGKRGQRVDLLGDYAPYVATISSLLDQPVRKRSALMDARRSGKPYWGTTIEVTARAFESAVKHQLGDQEHKNDYLVNILDENLFGLESALTGQVDSDLTLDEMIKESCYPYPTIDESEANRGIVMDLVQHMKALSPIFSEPFDMNEFEALHEEDGLPLFEPLAPVQFMGQQALF